jgi:hypothetical protein
MMRQIFTVLICCVGCLAVAASAQEQAKQAASTTETSAAALEVRADQHFLGGDWGQALDMYKKLARMVKNDPAKLGPVEERIRVCERNLAKKAATSGASTPTVSPISAPTSPPTGEQRKPLTPPKEGQVLDLSIKDLGNFDYDQEKGGNIPKDVKGLTGHTVRLRGFMIPMDQADNITKFALVPDLFACCFGQPPQIQHMVVANCPEGKAVGYSPDEILVEGKLNVEEKKDDGYIISIFEVTVSSVKAAPR